MTGRRLSLRERRWQVVHVVILLTPWIFGAAMDATPERAALLGVEVLPCPSRQVPRSNQGVRSSPLLQIPRHPPIHPLVEGRPPRIPLLGQLEQRARRGRRLLLASPAAAMITGESLKVDGGWTAW